MDGTGGKHIFEFKIKSYCYEIYRYIIGSESEANASIIVEKNHKTISHQDGYLVKLKYKKNRAIARFFS
jgi:hypothetical protein